MVNTAATQGAISNSSGQTMNADAAIHYNALVLNIKRETGITIQATEGTRTYARQKQLYDMYLAGRGNPAWSPESPYAYHMSGRAVDVGSNVGYVNTRESREFYARAGRFGFRPSVAGEPWHFEWRGEWVSPSLDLNTVNADPEPEPEPVIIPEAEEEEVFVLVKDARSATVFIVSLITGKRIPIEGTGDIKLLERLKSNKGENTGEQPMLVPELDRLRDLYLSKLV